MQQLTLVPGDISCYPLDPLDGGELITTTYKSSSKNFKIIHGIHSNMTRIDRFHKIQWNWVFINFQIDWGLLYFNIQIIWVTF